jgi:hypothetical protein
MVFSPRSPPGLFLDAVRDFSAYQKTLSKSRFAEAIKSSTYDGGFSVANNS